MKPDCLRVRPAVLAAFSVRCLSVVQLHERIRRRQRKIRSCQCQRFVNTRARIPEGGQQHLAVKVGGA